MRGPARRRRRPSAGTVAVSAKDSPETASTSESRRFGHTAELDAEAAVRAFDPARLTLARHRNGLTKVALAQRLEVSAAAITQFERRQARPSARTLQRAAHELGVPVDYFAAGRPQLVPAAEQTHFRSLRSTRQYERLQALALIAHAAEVVRVVEQVVRLPDVRVPEFDDLPPEDAARQLRAAWRLPAGPLPHLVRLAESKGIAVVIAPFGAEQRIDAFSCWSDHLDRPLVCLSSDRTNVLRRRFNAAHEIGHIVMHRGASPGSAEREREANAFAAEFLVPAAEVAPLLPHRVDLAALVELQREWGVSVQALLHRSTELEVLSDRAARQGWALLSKLGWRRDEPTDDLPGEWPSLLSEALALAAPRGLTPQRLASGLKLPAAEALELIGHRVDERPALHLVMPSEDQEFVG